MKPINILAIGDCNTSGKQGYIDKNNNITGKIAELFAKNNWATNLQNLGYTMSSSREGVMRSKLDAKPCDIAIINFGLVNA